MSGQLERSEQMKATMRCRAGIYQAIWIAAFVTCPVVTASDIGGEVVPPVCSYESDGSTAAGDPAACGETLRIASIHGGVGDTAILSPTPTAQPWALTETLGGEQLTLGFTGTFGPYMPISTDPFRRGNPTESGHVLARWFSVSVRNTSAVPWGAFRFELRTNLNVPSDEDDTISFGEWLSSSLLWGPPSSRDFSRVNVNEPGFDASGSDVLLFSGGNVAPNEVAQFEFLISSNTVSDFYLMQQGLPEAVPEPASAFLIGLGLCAVILGRQHGRFRA